MGSDPARGYDEDVGLSFMPRVLKRHWGALLDARSARCSLRPPGDRHGHGHAAILPSVGETWSGRLMILSFAGHRRGGGEVTASEATEVQHKRRFGFLIRATRADPSSCNRFRVGWLSPDLLHVNRTPLVCE